MLRSLKTLGVRLRQQESNARLICEALKENPHVTDVFYVGDPGHPDYALSCRQTVGFGAMASFKTDAHQRALDVLERTKLALFAESLGGTEGLVTYPLVQTHDSTPVCQHQNISTSGTLASNGIPMRANNRLRTTTSITAFQRGNTAVFHMASLQKACHSVGIGTTGNAMSENIHVSHYSNQVFNALNGNCWSCLSMYFDENGLADGFSQTFPLDWLYERNALIATRVGGEPIERSFGDINQLWIEGAATRLFVRDIVSVEFRTLDNPQPRRSKPKRCCFKTVPTQGCAARGDAAGGLVGGRPNLVGEPMEFTGYACDFDRAIAAVEFSLDQGQTWTCHDTPTCEPGRMVWWSFAYTPVRPGSYELLVRAVNIDGEASPAAARYEFDVGRLA